MKSATGSQRSLVLRINLSTNIFQYKLYEIEPKLMHWHVTVSLIIFGFDQRNIYWSGTWTNNFRINLPALYQLSYPALCWRSPYSQYLRPAPLNFSLFKPKYFKTIYPVSFPCGLLLSIFNTPKKQQQKLNNLLSRVVY